MMKRISGFTLIELLIVVAIIAILAAIAVPNFLEAQTRSKVSRVRADQRSLATAIEAYYVDNNSYPAATSASQAPTVTSADNIPSIVTGAPIRNTPTFQTRAGTQLLSTLTTPISYITSYFPDPFADSRSATFRYGLAGSSAQPLAGWLIWSFGPDTDEAISASSIAGDTFIGYVSGSGRVLDTVYSPDLNIPSNTLIQITYDPTNGTTSNGDVWRVKQ